jgi:hypothetical protein
MAWPSRMTLRPLRVPPRPHGAAGRGRVSGDSRREAAGFGREAAGPRRGPAGPRRGPAGPRRGPAGLCRPWAGRKRRAAGPGRPAGAHAEAGPRSRHRRREHPGRYGERAGPRAGPPPGPASPVSRARPRWAGRWAAVRWPDRCGHRTGTRHEPRAARREPPGGRLAGRRSREGRSLVREVPDQGSQGAGPRATTRVILLRRPVPSSRPGQEPPVPAQSVQAQPVVLAQPVLARPVRAQPVQDRLAPGQTFRGRGRGSARTPSPRTARTAVPRTRPGAAGPAVRGRPARSAACRGPGPHRQWPAARRGGYAPPARALRQSRPHARARWSPWPSPLHRPWLARRHPPGGATHVRRHEYRSFPTTARAGTRCAAPRGTGAGRPAIPAVACFPGPAGS